MSFLWFHSIILNPDLHDIYIWLLNLIFNFIVIFEISIIMNYLFIFLSRIDKHLDYLSKITFGICCDNRCISAKIALPLATKSSRVFPQILFKNYSDMMIGFTIFNIQYNIDLSYNFYFHFYLYWEDIIRMKRNS